MLNWNFMMDAVADYKAMMCKEVGLFRLDMVSRLQPGLVGN